jgi:hypothetical protein
MQPYPADYTRVPPEKRPGDKRNFYRFALIGFTALAGLWNYACTGAGYHLERYRCDIGYLASLCQDEVRAGLEKEYCRLW